MAGGTRPDILTDAEYERMLALLGGAPKGRLFLAEYASQARAEDTRALFAAMAGIESSLATMREQLRPDAIAAELRRIAGLVGEALERADIDGDRHALARAKCELTALAGALAGGTRAGLADAGDEAEDDADRVRQQS
ncbi:MAG TPA: hypothetical protein VHG92_02050 [Afifellaceae bacterium]|nr:hypothetical protein [Afifellaceae bacterium]